MDQFLEEESDLNGSMENGDDEMLITGSPEPPVDASETLPGKARLNNPFSGVSAAELEPDLELPADPHQENVDERFENPDLNESLSDILEPGIVENTSQQAQSAPSDDLKLEYTQVMILMFNHQVITYISMQIFIAYLLCDYRSAKILCGK